MDRDLIRHKVISLLSDVLNNNELMILEEHKINTDLKASYLDIMEFIIDVDLEFNIDIESDEFYNNYSVTVKDIIDKIYNELGK